MENFRGKTAVITGGAAGIGLGMAKAFADEGVNLVLLDVEADVLSAAEAELTTRGVEVLGIVLDVMDRAAMAAAAQAALDRFGAVHILCNNAGVNASAPIDRLTYDDWDWVLGVNVHGVVNGLVTFLPELKRHGPEAYVVNTASVGGLAGMRNLSVYNASKFAVVGLSESFRADMAETGIGISVLCPGIVRTGIGNSARNRPDRFQETGETPVSAEAIASGTDPAELGRIVVESMRKDRFFICPHPEFREIIQERNRAVEAAFVGEADPAAVDAMRTLVRRF